MLLQNSNNKTYSSYAEFHKTMKAPQRCYIPLISIWALNLSNLGDSTVSNRICSPHLGIFKSNSISHHGET